MVVANLLQKGVMELLQVLLWRIALPRLPVGMWCEPHGDSHRVLCQCGDMFCECFVVKPGESGTLFSPHPSHFKKQFGEIWQKED